jgi:hypothetical protein
MRTAFAVALLVVAPSVVADGLNLPTFDLRYEWNTTDTVLQSGVALLQIADWRQTRWFLKNPPRCTTTRSVTTCNGTEADVAGMLGGHPSMGRLNAVIGLSIVGHAAISYLLPSPLRNVWQLVWIGIEGSAVRANHKEGVPVFGLAETTQRLESTDWTVVGINVAPHGASLTIGRAFQ